MVEAIEHLKKREFTHNFSINKNGLMEESRGIVFDPKEVKLMEFHRFEGTSDPADSSIIYAVETASGIRGIVVDMFGAAGSEVTSDFMNKVEQKQFDS